MKIYISFDTNNLTGILELSRSCELYFDHFIMGTLPIYKEGVGILKMLKHEFPKKLMLAKIRVTDYAQEHVHLFSIHGVNAITVLPGMSRTMLHGITLAAHDVGMQVILEIFDTTFMNQAILEAKQLGIDVILLHYFQDKNNPQALSEQWDFIKDNINLPMLLETNFTQEIIDILPVLRPYGIVISENFLKTKQALDDLKYIQQLFENK